MYSSQNFNSPIVYLNYQQISIHRQLIKIYNIGLKLCVKTYDKTNSTCNFIKTTLWRKIWQYEPYLNELSNMAMISHFPCETRNLQNYSTILRVSNSGKLHSWNHLKKNLIFFDTTKVMASTTIYTIENIREEKSTKRDTTKRKSSLKKEKCRCKQKPKHVKVSEPEPPSKDVEVTEEEIKNLEEVLKEIDAKLDRNEDLENCLRSLMKLRRKMPDNPNILWRIGKAYQKFAEKEQNVETKLNYVEKGIESCGRALDIVYEQADAHKWMAILVGYKGQFQSTKEKIYCGKLFKKHLDIAIFLNPSDPVLQHMAGRFCLEIASLSWVERKIAKQVFPDPINCSLDIAIQHFLQAEKFMGQKAWKENKLLIAKCYIMKEDYEQALEWLDEAKKATDGLAGEMVEKEIEQLLQKYSKYR